MGRSRYPLRLHPSLMEEARKAAESEGVALNQLFNVAVAEKLAGLRTVTRFQERIRCAGRPKTLHILDLTGIGNPPMEGDGIQIRAQQIHASPPPDCAPDGQSTGETATPFGRATPQFGKLKKWLERTRGR